MRQKEQKFLSLLQKCLELEQSVGMIGGKPYSAYYFYGYAGKLFSISEKKKKEIARVQFDSIYLLARRLSFVS